MPKVPERKLSYGEILENQRLLQKSLEPRKKQKSFQSQFKRHNKPKVPKIYRLEYGRQMNHIRSIMNEN